MTPSPAAAMTPPRICPGLTIWPKPGPSLCSATKPWGGYTDYAAGRLTCIHSTMVLSPAPWDAAPKKLGERTILRPGPPAHCLQIARRLNQTTSVLLIFPELRTGWARNQEVSGIRVMISLTWGYPSRIPDTRRNADLADWNGFPLIFMAMRVF